MNPGSMKLFKAQVYVGLLDLIMQLYIRRVFTIFVSIIFPVLIFKIKAKQHGDQDG